MRRARWLASLLVVVSLALAACQSDDQERRTVDIERCGLSDLLVPECGTLWGISTGPGIKEPEVEDQLGRKFDFLYHYHDLYDQVPTEQERKQVEDGQHLHISITARDFKAADAHGIRWREVADGEYDDSLRRQAQGIKSLDEPVFMTFDQEANQKTKVQRRGPAKDFVEAWRHVHDIFEDEGATNAVWVWVMTGNPWRAPAGPMWPGNDVVDWISWNVYNQSGCRSGPIRPDKYESFEQALMPFYRWLHNRGETRFGIDSSKPVMISELGSVLYADDPQRTADWYAEIPDVLREYPQIKAVTLWDSATSDTCDYRFQRDSSVMDAVGKAGENDWLRQVK